eukprot:11742588-Karenia_brevis.AAC.1
MGEVDIKAFAGNAGVEGWVEKPTLTVEGGVKNVGMLESSKPSETEKSKAWYVGAVQCGVPYERRRRENRFEQLVEDGEEETIEIP